MVTVIWLSFFATAVGAQPSQNFGPSNPRKDLSEPTPRSEVWDAYPDFPEYMKNWEYGINIDEGQGPRYFADLIFPLYRPDAEDRTLFFEPRVNHADSETLFNLGLGWRQFIKDRTWMLGGNLFFDLETQYAHKRFGVGVEALSAFAELRANSYFGFSRTRTTEPGISSSIVQRPVDGFDVEVGGPVPYYSKLKLFGGYEWYDFKKFNNRSGWSVRAEYTPIRVMVLDITLSDNTERRTGWGMTVALRPPFWENTPSVEKVRSAFKLDKVIFPDSDVSDRLYTLVERHHEIVVESYVESKGQVTVQIKRGT